MDVASALKDDGAQSEFDEAQGGKKSARTCSDYNHACPSFNIRIRYRLKVHTWCRLPNKYFHAEVHHDITLARVDAPASQAQVCDVFWRDAKLCSRSVAQQSVLVCYFGSQT